MSVFIESRVWDGIKGDEMAEVFDRIGPSLRKSKRQAPPEPKIPALKGTIAYYNDRGFGYIATEEGGRLFFHVRDSRSIAGESIRKGTPVRYEMGTDRDGRPAAVNVKFN